MSEPREVAILSAFGRGHWLAAELAQAGIQSTVVDVTGQLGRWAPEDWEGPFGVLQPQTLTVSQRHRLTEEEALSPQTDGFSLWPPEGPLDLRGWLVPHWLESRPEVRLASQILGETQLVNWQQAREQIRFDDLAFSEQWLTLFGFQFAAPVMGTVTSPWPEAMGLPIFSAYALRQVSRRSLVKSLEWCERQGVEALASSEVHDIGFEGREQVFLELGGESRRSLTAEKLVISLSSAELVHLVPKARDVVLPRGSIEAEWAWLRWRLILRRGQLPQVLPRQSVWLQDLGLPWTHANLLVVQRCSTENNLDAWMRVPSLHRFQRDYIENLGREAAELVRTRLPETEVAVQDQPQDYHYGRAELGPSLFPVFRSEDVAKFRASQSGPALWDGPEMWNSLDWTGRFARQNELVTELKRWKKQKTEKELKRGARDRALHAP